MKNLMKAFGTAILVSGVFAVASAQTPAAQTPATKTTAPATKPATKADKVIGTDAKGNKVYKGANGNYYMNDKGVKTMEPKDAKITPVTPAPKTK